VAKRKIFRRKSGSGAKGMPKWLLWLIILIVWGLLIRLPVKGGKLTSIYGFRSSGFHYGSDLGVPIGTAVKPITWGKVRRTGFDNRSGNLVMITHLPGLESRYYHLDSVKVAGGQRVSPSTVIGTSGNTGQSSGPHLHFEIRVLGVALPPYLLCLSNAVFGKIVGVMG